MKRGLLLLSVLAFLACGGSAATGRVSVRDSAGIEIVESVPPASSATTPWVIDSLPLFDIGADQSDPHQEFSRPSSPMRLADGRIVVAEPGTQELRFFDSAGVWIRSVGRKGEGPGEFKDLRRLFLGPDDSLFASEPGTGFVSVLDSAGRYARRVRPEFPGEGRFIIFSGVFDNGHWLVDGTRAEPPNRAGMLRSRTDLFEYSGEGKKLDSIASMPGWEAWGEPVGNRGYMYRYVPFRRGSVYRVAGPRLFYGVTERLDLAVYRSGSGLERIVRIRVPGRPLTRELVERTLERQMAEWTRTPAEEVEKHRKTVLGVSYPPELPVFDSLAVAANGDLWFREYVADAEEPVRYIVADSNGRWKAFAVGPARFAPSWIGTDRVIGLWLDPDDVAHVRAYRLGK